MTKRKLRRMLDCIINFRRIREELVKEERSRRFSDRIEKPKHVQREYLGFKYVLEIKKRENYLDQRMIQSVFPFPVVLHLGGSSLEGLPLPRYFNRNIDEFVDKISRQYIEYPLNKKQGSVDFEKFCSIEPTSLTTVPYKLGGYFNDVALQHGVFYKIPKIYAKDEDEVDNLTRKFIEFNQENQEIIEQALTEVHLVYPVKSRERIKIEEEFSQSLKSSLKLKF